MISTFDIARLNGLLRDFHRVSGIYATVLDDGFRVLAAQPDEVTDFCRLLRGDARAEAACRRCDAEACQKVARSRAAFTYVCHAGLTEAIAPLCVDGFLAGYLMFGHGLAYPTYDAGWAEVGRRCRSYGVDQRLLKSLFFEMPLLDGSFIAAALNILTVVASFLCTERLASLRREELPVKIDEYLAANCLRDVTPEDACAEFHIGRTKLYEIMRQSYGTGFAEHIRRLRIDRAKELIKRDDAPPLAEIAAQCGFGDYNYFITVFRKTVGLPPGRFKKRAAARPPL